MSSRNYETQILDTIQMLVDNAVSKAEFDKTIKATISRCIDATIGKYVVKYQDSSFYAYSYNTENIYTAGTAVYVLIPGNDMSQEKSIIGTVDKLGKDYVSIAEGENGYEVTGVNVITAQSSYELCSYESESIQVLYDRDTGSSSLTIDTFGLENYIKQSNSIICGATFKTNLPSEQRFRGDYGIVFNLDFIDNATGEIVTRSYMVNTTQMKGQPYNFSTPSRQYGIFEVDGSNFVSIKQIYIFSYDFPHIAEDKPNDIFISKIELSAANALTTEDLSSTALTLITPQGIYFDDSNLDTDTKLLEAQIRVKGKNIDSDSQDIKYYWFRENGLITTKSQAYNKYGGAGWECLNLFNTISEEGTEALVEWVPNSYQYVIKKSDNIAQETKYKCVAIYNTETVLVKTITIYNYSSDYEITIKSDEGTTFYYDLGRPTLTCYVNGEEQTSEEYTYAWSSIDNNNRFKNIGVTATENAEYLDAYIKYNTLLTQIENNEVLLSSAQAELALYKRVLDQYEYIMRVEGNKIHQLKISEITNFTSYKCSVFRNGLAIGTASIIISNNLKNENNYSVVINNGNQVFKYNEQGIAPDNKSLENPITVLPLSFTVYDNEGREVSAEAIGLKNVYWTVPCDKTLISSKNLTSPVDEIDGAKIYNNLAELHFGLATKYSIKNDNNTIQLKIDYKDGRTLTAQTNFTFTKTGEIGTNGTDFVCKIIPNLAEGIAPKYPTVIYNEYLKTYKLNYESADAEKWFEVQLWHDGELIFSGTESGTSTEDREAIVTWSILQNNYGKDEKGQPIKDKSNLTIGSLNGSIAIDATEYENPANIIKCNIKYDGVEYYATMPVIFSRVKNEEYEILLTEGSGFRSVMYTADGQMPSYNNLIPYDITVNQVISGVKENISLYEPENYRVDYDWAIKGEVYFSDWQSSQNLLAKTTYGEKRNQKSFRPSDTFDGLCVNNALLCNITQGGEKIGSIHIPVHLYLNRYGNAAMNGWDGNSITFDNEGGLILAPQVGAGTKNEDNSFTGVFMGTVKETGMTMSEHGLFGYSSGERTITLSAEDGSARFGRKGAGQIVIDPSTGEALLTSGNYDEEKGTGMEINLSKPSIRFGSGKFGVNANGEVFADGFATTEYVEAEVSKVHKDIVSLEQSIPVFDIQLASSSLIIPCDSSNIPLESSTYTINYRALFQNKELTDGYTVSVRSLQNSSSIIINTSTLGQIIINTLPEGKIPNLINDFIFTFEYTDANQKTYKVEKQFSITLAMQGKDGVIGKDGEAGKSAYQIWLDAGNTGSEEDYLASLKGADGEPGKDGEQGPQGEPGGDGEPGIGVKEIIEQYYLSSSDQNQQDGEWLETQETPTSQRPYIWTRSKITWTDNSVTTTTPILASAINNANAAASDAANAAEEANKTALEAKADATDASAVATQAKDEATAATSTANDALTKANTVDSKLTGLTTIVDQNYTNLQNQIDGAISTWFDNYVPTNQNEPAKTWVENKEEAKHIGDLFYITSGDASGRCYRYAYVNNEYEWVLVEDADVTKAIEDAAQAKAAADGKATIFVGAETPQNPQEGDLWMKSADDGILTYVNGKWEEFNKYTDNTVANEALTKVNTAVSEVNVQYYLSTENDKLSGGSWKNDAPTWVDGKFMWSRTKVILKDGTTTYQPSENGTCIAGATGATGGAGPQGVGVSSITELYYLSNSTTAPSKPTTHITSTSTSNGVWTTKCPTWTSTYKYYWTCSEILYTNNNYGWSTPILAAGLNSANETASNASTAASNADAKAAVAQSTADEAKATASSADTKAKEAKSAIDNLEIGGRNLVLSSNTEITSKNTITTYNLSEYGVTNLTPGTKIVMSLDVKADVSQDKFDVYIRSEDSQIISGQCKITTPDVWTRFTFQDAILSSATDKVPKWFAVRTTTNAGGTGTTTVNVRNVKVELGTKGTDWTAAPEDTIKDVVVQYLATTSASKPTTTDGWSENFPGTTDLFIWQRTVTTYWNGSDAVTGMSCIYSPVPMVDEVVDQYIFTTSTTEPAEGAEWKSGERPKWTNGIKEGEENYNPYYYHYLWVRTAYMYTDGSILYSAPYLDVSWSNNNVLQTDINTNIKNIQDQLTGGSVKIRDGTIYVAGDPNDDQKKNCAMLINAGGISFSQDGGETFNSVWGINGVFDAQSIVVTNLTASDIQDGTLKLGGHQESDGKLKIYDKSKRLVASGGNDGFIVYSDEHKFPIDDNKPNLDEEDSSYAHKSCIELRDDTENMLVGFTSDGSKYVNINEKTKTITATNQKAEEAVIVGDQVKIVKMSGGIGFVALV